MKPFAGFEFGEPPITSEQAEAELRQWRGFCRLSLYHLAHRYRKAAAYLRTFPWEANARTALAHANRLSQEARQ